MHKRYLTLALCCGAVAIAGCGSSSSSNSSTGAATGPANNQVFSADLNALCKQANAGAKKVPRWLASSIIWRKSLELLPFSGATSG